MQRSTSLAEAAATRLRRHPSLLWLLLPPLPSSSSSPAYPTSLLLQDWRWLRGEKPQRRLGQGAAGAEAFVAGGLGFGRMMDIDDAGRAVWWPSTCANAKARLGGRARARRGCRFHARPRRVSAVRKEKGEYSPWWLARRARRSTRAAQTSREAGPAHNKLLRGLAKREADAKWWCGLVECKASWAGCWTVRARWLWPRQSGWQASEVE